MQVQYRYLPLCPPSERSCKDSGCLLRPRSAGRISCCQTWTWTGWISSLHFPFFRFENKLPERLQKTKLKAQHVEIICLATRQTVFIQYSRMQKTWPYMLLNSRAHAKITYKWARKRWIANQNFADFQINIADYIADDISNRHLKA